MDFNLATTFPNKQRITGFEGGVVYGALKDGKFFLIVDSRTLADFLEDDYDIKDRLITVYEFDNEDEFNSHIKKWKDRYEQRNHRF
ncbi:MAG: hypothetical protein KKA84_05250 [Bacteroidetes bacterium]|nr:hypothetical protein [Bacteroidota bacterium]